MKDCCNDDCNQGRDCPDHRKSGWTKGDVIFTIVMLAVTTTVTVSLMWWVVKQISEIVGVLK